METTVEFVVTEISRLDRQESQTSRGPQEFLRLDLLHDGPPLGDLYAYEVPTPIWLEATNPFHQGKVRVEQRIKATFKVLDQLAEFKELEP